MIAVAIKVETPNQLPPFVTKGHRIDSKIQEVDVHVTPLNDKTHIRVGESNFLVKGDYYVGGHILCVRFGLAAGAELNEKFEPVWSGVYGQRRLLERTSSEALVEIDVGDVVDVFHRDGVVSQITMQEPGKIVKTILLPEVMLAKRLDIIGASFNKALAMPSKTEQDLSEKNRKIDKQFHELAALLRLTALFPHLRESITKTVSAQKLAMKQWNGNTPLNRGVRDHLRECLRAIGDDHQYIWLKGFEAIPSEPRKDMRILPRTSPLSQGRKAKTPEEKRAIEQRRKTNKGKRDRASLSGSKPEKKTEE